MFSSDSPPAPGKSTGTRLRNYCLVHLIFRLPFEEMEGDVVVLELKKNKNDRGAYLIRHQEEDLVGRVLRVDV